MYCFVTGPEVLAKPEQIPDQISEELSDLVPAHLSIYVCIRAVRGVQSDTAPELSWVQPIAAQSVRTEGFSCSSVSVSEQ